MSDSELPVPAAPRRAPPMPAKFRPQEWWIGVDGEARGPFGQDHVEREIRSGAIVGSTPVANVNDDTWTTAGEDPIVSGLLSKRATLPTLRAPEHAAHAVSDYRSFWANPTPLDEQPRVARAMPSISAERGATVVNVVNQIEAPRLPPVVGDAADKSPGLALFLSLLIVGLGQLYNGDFGKGIGMFVLSIFLWAFFLGWLVNIWSMIDAYSSAKSKRDNYNLLRTHAYR